MCCIQTAPTCEISLLNQLSSACQCLCPCLTCCCEEKEKRKKKKKTNKEKKEKKENEFDFLKQFFSILVMESVVASPSTSIASSSSPSSSSSSSSSVQVFEWERKLGSYSSSHLLPTDPCAWTDLEGRPLSSSSSSSSSSLLSGLSAPSGCVWLSDWAPLVVAPRATDAEGWEYAWNTAGSTWRPHDQGLVRRRRWTRSYRALQQQTGTTPNTATAHKGVDQVGYNNLKLIFVSNSLLAGTKPGNQKCPVCCFHHFST